MQRVPRQRPRPGRLTASPFLEARPRSLRIAPGFASRQWVAARYPSFRSITQLLDAGGTVDDAGPLTMRALCCLERGPLYSAERGRMETASGGDSQPQSISQEARPSRGGTSRGGKSDPFRAQSEGTSPGHARKRACQQRVGRQTSRVNNDDIGTRSASSRVFAERIAVSI